MQCSASQTREKSRDEFPLQSAAECVAHFGTVPWSLACCRVFHAVVELIVPSPAAATRQALRALSLLDVHIVLRLCTDDDSVASFYGDIDKEVELSLEVRAGGPADC